MTQLLYLAKYRSKVCVLHDNILRSSWFYRLA